MTQKETRRQRLRDTETEEIEIDRDSQTDRDRETQRQRQTAIYTVETEIQRQSCGVNFHLPIVTGVHFSYGKRLAFVVCNTKYNVVYAGQ